MASVAAATPPFRQVQVERLSVRNELANVFRLQRDRRARRLAVSGVGRRRQSGRPPQSPALPGADSESIDHRTARLPRAAGGTARGRRHSIDGERLAGDRHARAAKASRRLRQIRPQGRAYQWTLAARRQLHQLSRRPRPTQRARVARADSGARPGYRPDQTSKTKSITGCSTARCSMCPHGNVRRAWAAAGAIVRLPQAEGWTQLYAVGPGRLTPSDERPIIRPCSHDRDPRSPPRFPSGSCSRALRPAVRALTSRSVPRGSLLRRRIRS